MECTNFYGNKKFNQDTNGDNKYRKKREKDKHIQPVRAEKLYHHCTLAFSSWEAHQCLN